MNISWSRPDLPPWRSDFGYKLNWDDKPLMPIAVLSVKADTLSVEVDLNYTGLVFISVWVFSRGGEGPAVVLSEWEGECSVLAWTVLYSKVVYFVVCIVHACVTVM